MKNSISIFTEDELLNWSGVSALDSMRQYLNVIRLKAGNTLFRENDQNDTFYILIGGRLRAHSETWDLLTTELNPGRAIGEMAVLTGRPYIATVTAIEDSVLIAINHHDFTQMIKRHPEIRRYFNEIIIPRIQSNYLTTILHRLFHNLPDALVNLIQDRVKWQHIRSDEVVFEEGDPGTDLIIVVTGRLQVIKRQAAGERVIAEIHRGEMVGEFALLTDAPRSATVKAIRNSDIVRLSKADFETLVHQYPEALIKITQIIIKRQQSTGKKQRTRSAHSLNFAVIFLDDVQIPLVDALAAELVPEHKVRVFDAERFSQHYGQADAAQVAFDDYTNLLISEWLTELEVNYNYVFLVSESEWTNWTRRCLENGDRILLVANSRHSPELRDIEQKLSELFPNKRQDLILLHPSEVEQPTGTMRWLEARRIQKHYHVREGDATHIARVARHLSGGAYGLALSGGGAAGLAHIGVLRALEEAQVPIDMIGGTSMGSLIGAGIATGKNSDDMAELARDLSTPKKLFDFTLPFVSLLTTHKITRLLQALFGDIQIEDLWIPYFCVSTNLTKSRAVYHESGPLWRAIRASSAIPVAMAPIGIDGELYIDGTLMNNFPVDIMTELIEGGYIIGVMVSPTVRTEEPIADLGSNLSGWRILRNRLNPFATRLEIPTLMDTFMRAMQANYQYHFQTVEHLADLAIVLQENYYRFHEVGKYQAIIEHGYQASRPKIMAWSQDHNLQHDETEAAS